jgi:hypothetical protein
MAARTLEIHIKAKDLYDRELNKARAKFQSVSENIRQNFVANFARAAGAVIAFKKAFDISKEAAKFDQQQQAFANLAASHGVNSADMIRSLKAVSAQTISTAGIMEAAGNAMVLGIPAGQLVEMMEIARASARITGQSVQKSFDDIALGVGRQSRMILDNLGILVDSESAYAEYAATLGTTADKLTETQKKQAFVNATMKAGRDIIKRVGVEGITAAEAMEAFGATLDNLRITAGKVVISVSAALSGVAFEISKVFAQVLKTAASALAAIFDLAGKIPIVGEAYRDAAVSVRAFADQQGMAASEADRLASKSFDVATAIWREKTAIEGVAAARQQAEVETAASPEEDPHVQASIWRMQFREQEIEQFTRLTDAMAFHAERGVSITEQMAASIVVANQRMAWSAQARASITNKANAEMQNMMLKLIETGKFSVGAFAQIMAQQVKIELAGIAAKAAVRALYETGLGLATAFVNPVESAGHFAAAGQLALVSGASIAAAAGVHAIAGGTAEQPAAGTAGGAPFQTEQVGAGLIGTTGEPTQPTQQIIVNLRVDGVISAEEMDRHVEENLAGALKRAVDRDIEIVSNA